MTSEPGSGEPPAARVLAAWASQLTTAAIPGTVQRTVRRHLLDALGCAVAGVRGGAADPALTVARGLGGPPEATLWSRPAERVGAPASALGNAVAVHALDFDDTHAGGLVHMSAVTVPVALAVGEQVGAGGDEMLAALTAGMETVCRLGAAAPHGFHARGLHATSVCGVVAAAVTAARLMALDEDTTVHAIGIAASGAGGLLEFLHTAASTKQLHPGLAVHSGILAARLAAAGATGPESALDGDYGLFAALAARRPDREALVAGLGLRWECARVTIKPYPACQLSHASLDAARALAGRAGEIASIVADVHPDTAPIVCGPGKASPRSPYEAKFSLPWSVAAMVLDGEVGVSTFDGYARSDVAALAGRITHRVSPGDGVAADQPGRLTVAFHNGRTEVVEVERSGGGPDDPAIDEVVLAKARTNLGESVGELAAAIASGASAAELASILPRML